MWITNKDSTFAFHSAWSRKVYKALFLKILGRLDESENESLSIFCGTHL